nr:MAG TPA: hypothetical protein [Ackermannviridae sp.]
MVVNYFLLFTAPFITTLLSSSSYIINHFHYLTA